MNRKSRSLVVLVTFGLVPAAASPVALAGGPLLSGYGGPGTGEQAVIGSTLIGGAGGSGGSAGSGGSGSAAPATAGAGSSATAPGITSAVTGGSSAGASASDAAGKGGVAGKDASGATRVGGSHPGSVSTGGPAGDKGVQVHAFVYPTALRSASVDSPALGISGSDLLLCLVAIAALALVAVATLRLSRLQSRL